MCCSSLVYILFSYLVGSLPFGYFFSIRKKKNILEIGWKKTSATNVFQNVGKVEGFLTALFDFLKGAFVVWLARTLSLGLNIEIFAGIAAIVGHNWSLYLKFRGGRGIATFIGVSLVLFPKILFIPFILFLFFSFIWDASIGTILLFLGVLFFVYFNEMPSIYKEMIVLSSFLVFIKRLSPMKEVIKSSSLRLFVNRLIFDNDNYRGFRIRRIFKYLTRKNTLLN